MIAETFGFILFGSSIFSIAFMNFDKFGVLLTVLDVISHSVNKQINIFGQLCWN